MGDSKQSITDATRYICLVASILTICLGLVHVFRSDVSMHWPSGSITSDDQALSWRAPLFTFVPDVFLDVWTPFVLGCLGVMAQLDAFKGPKVFSKNFMRSFGFNFATALFGNLGYDGGLGILIGAVSLLAALMSLISFFLDSTADGSLHMKTPVKVT